MIWGFIVYSLVCHPLLEQALGEDGEVDAPVGPDVAAVVLVVLVGVAALVEQGTVLDVGLVEEVFLADADPVELRGMLELTDEFVLHIVVDIAVRTFGTSHATCGSREEADVVEEVGIVERGVEGVHAAHGEAADGAGALLLDDAVVALDILDDVGEGSLEVAGNALIATERGGGIVGALAEGGRLAGIAVGHDDDHRLGLALRDEVVHDLCGTTEVGPCFLVAACSVEEVEDRVLLLALLIACGGVDGEATLLHAERGAGVPDLADVAVGDVLYGVEVALLTGDDEDAAEAGDVARLEAVVGVGHGEAIDDEAIAIEFRGKGLGGEGPHAVLILRHGDAAEVVLKLDLRGAGGIVTGNDTAIIADIDGLHALALKDTFLSRHRQHGQNEREKTENSFHDN